ncbi:CBS domain-containing protein [Microbacterium aurum]
MHVVVVQNNRGGDIVQTDAAPTAVAADAADAAVGDVQAAAERSGHLRILVGAAPDCLVAHVRDTLPVPSTTSAASIARRPLALEPTASAYDALTRMRRDRVQPATVVMDGRLRGVVTIDGLLREILPRS